MSGLFHRLAWRALGRPSPIRPIVGHNVPVAWSSSDAAGEGRSSAPALQPILDSQPLEAFPSPVEAAVDVRALAVAVEAAAASPAAREAMLPPAPAENVKHTLPDLPRAAERSVRPTREQSVLERSARVSQAVAGDGGRAAPVTAEFAAAHAAPAIRVDSKTRNARRAREDAGRGDDDGVALLPLRAAARRATSAALPGARIPGPFVVPARAREAPTEVHVTIGRIELTTAPAGARPRREPSRPRKPQSLEEYLARRETARR